MTLEGYMIEITNHSSIIIVNCLFLFGAYKLLGLILPNIFQELISS